MPVIERRGGRSIAQGTPEAIEGTLSFKQAVFLSGDRARLSYNIGIQTSTPKSKSCEKEQQNFKLSRSKIFRTSGSISQAAHRSCIDN
jgi:hypothetical protein